MQEKIIEELRKELKDQIEENKELNDSITWWKNRYEAQVKINEEHKKLNDSLHEEICKLKKELEKWKKKYGNQ